jgi:predicted phosphodiesterase
MRYAIISDVHANEAALRSVLMDAADARVDKIICLGDVLGYGPDPVAALELI